MKIKVGDKIAVGNIEGYITKISIALDYDDKKAESGINVERYDTDLDYIGVVDYKDEYNQIRFTTFNKITRVIEDININELCDDIVHQQLFGI